MNKCFLQILFGMIRSLALISVTILCSYFIDYLIATNTLELLRIGCITSFFILIHSVSLYFEKKYAAMYVSDWSIRTRNLIIKKSLINGNDKIVTYFDSILDSLENYKESIGTVIVCFFTIIIAVLTAININVFLAMLAIIPIPFSLIISNKLLTELKQVNNKTLKYIYQFNVDAFQTITSYYELKIIDATPQILRILSAEVQKIKNCEREKNRINSIQGRIGICARFMPQLIIPLVGGIFCYKSLISIGELIIMNIIISYIVNPIETIIGFIRQRKELADVLNELNLIEKTSINNLKVNRKILKNPQISFENVCFSYRKNREIISNLNLLIVCGDTVIIEGESGKGKTTLIKLLMGILSPEHGCIYVGNYKIKGRHISQSLISYMPQNPQIFSASLKDNICLSQEYDEMRFNRIIELVCLNDFISKQKDGIYTVIGEGGIKLSGGEIKRVAIARALYEEKSIYIFDEPFAGLDLDIMNQIQKNISKELISNIVILISHQEILNWSGCIKKIVL